MAKTTSWAVLDKASLKKITDKLEAVAHYSQLNEGLPIPDALNASGLILETAIKEAPEMPVVTGRLRSSFHTKFEPDQVHTYTDLFGQVWDGTLKEPIKPNEEVVVGSNVIYAAKQNEYKGFINKAFERSLPEIHQLLGDALHEIMSKKTKL